MADEEPYLTTFVSDWIKYTPYIWAGSLKRSFVHPLHLRIYNYLLGLCRLLKHYLKT